MLKIAHNEIFTLSKLLNVFGNELRLEFKPCHLFIKDS